LFRVFNGGVYHKGRNFSLVSSARGALPDKWCGRNRKLIHHDKALAWCLRDLKWITQAPRWSQSRWACPFLRKREELS
jgi:hypothetical protein